MRLIALLCWLWMPQLALAQSAQVLRGRVLDAETHQPIPNVQVGVANNKIGTSTNDDGRFALNIPAAYAQENLTVALIGYRSYAQALPPLPAPELRIELKISPAALGEVQVTGSVLGIVKEAVARIPQNYPVRPTQLTGFYRESDNDEAGRPRYLVEGLLTAFKTSYRKRAEYGDIKIQQSRKVDLRPDRELVRIDWAGGPFIVHRADFVHSRTQFINAAYFKYYDYRLAPGSTYAGRPVYVVTFGPKGGNHSAEFEGRMYIDQDTYAFLGAEWHATPTGLKHSSTEGATSRNLRASYQPYAGRWHLKTVWWQTSAHLPIGADLSYFGEFLTTAIDTAQAPPPSYTERAQNEDVFLRNDVAYDSAFWRGQTTLLPSEALRKSVLDQQREHLVDSLFRPATDSVPAVKKEGWLGQLFDRFRFGSTIGAWPLTTPGANLAVAYAPAGYRFQLQNTQDVAAQSLTGLYRIEFEIELLHDLVARLGTQSLFRKFDGAGWDAGLGYQHNFNPGHRPIYGRVGLSYNRQGVGRQLGTFDNADDGLRVAGKHLGADKLSAQIQQVNDALLPTLGIGVELSHKIELVADLGYLLPTRNITQLQLSEESGFILARRTATVDLPHPDVSLRINNQPAAVLPWQQQRWLFSLGVVFHAR
jgi:hypothetical protein